MFGGCGSAQTGYSCTVNKSKPVISSATADVEQLYVSGVSLLTAAQVSSPVADTELIIGEVLGLSRGQVQLAKLTKQQIKAADASKITEFLRRRTAREPLQHIIGKAYFYGLELLVGKGVFVPRPETELLVENAIKHWQTTQPNNAEPQIIDMCAGSGAITFAAKSVLPHSRVWAVEKADAAFTWLLRNQSHLGLAAHLVQTDLAALAQALGVKPLPGKLATATEILPSTVQKFAAQQGKFNLLLTNPPYIPQAAVPQDKEVSEFDPPAALYAGEDGLELLRWLVPLAAYLGAPGAYFIVEHAEHQGQELQAMFAACGFMGAQTIADFTGRPRFTHGVLPA